VLVKALNPFELIFSKSLAFWMIFSRDASQSTVLACDTLARVMLPHTISVKAVDVSDGLPLAVFRVFGSVMFLFSEVNISRVTVPVAKRVRAR
jgi:hypothetical protein